MRVPIISHTFVLHNYWPLFEACTMNMTSFIHSSLQWPRLIEENKCNVFVALKLAKTQYARI